MKSQRKIKDSSLKAGDRSGKFQVYSAYILLWLGTFRPLFSSKTGSQEGKQLAPFTCSKWGDGSFTQEQHNWEEDACCSPVSEENTGRLWQSTDGDKMASFLSEPNGSGWKDAGVWDKTGISVLFVSENSSEEYPWSHYAQVAGCSTTSWERCPFAPLIRQKSRLDWTQGVWLLPALKVEDKGQGNTSNLSSFLLWVFHLLLF